MSPALAGGLLTTAPPGKSHLHFKQKQVSSLSCVSKIFFQIVIYLVCSGFFESSINVLHFYVIRLALFSLIAYKYFALQYLQTSFLLVHFYVILIFN